MRPKMYVWRFDCEERDAEKDSDALADDTFEELVVHETLEQAIALFKEFHKDKYDILEIKMLGECLCQ